MRPSRILRLACSAAIGLALVACQAGAGGAVTPSGNQRVIELSMEDMRFVPDRIEVRQHETVRFLVHNPDEIPHEIFIGSEAEQLEHRRIHASTAPADQADISHFGFGTYVPAYGTGQFAYRFDSLGDILIGCHLPGHWEAGMRATISVVAD